ncbi:plastidic ATP ADP-transporter [Raphidocelis subcapitata]|uniref:ADP,ATP carrier protein n=1 Tax=Raphidocelis subcapitata TaxID=307507 RepID=A0A2V0PEQ9_9CHLO|nr:plastidic ATP ADP-transporter [Raphidocelis subcapitata]|eukprot:GBF98341.1 plastidic ATP ADP-transporter [Raphidocelis subcapitata]
MPTAGAATPLLRRAAMPLPFMMPQRPHLAAHHHAARPSPLPAPRAPAPPPRRDARAAAAAAGAALPADGEGGQPAGAGTALLVKKVAGLGTIFLGATINYTILQSLRDALVVTSCGAEALPFINGFCVLPLSLAFFVYYDKLVTAFEKTPNAVFYWAIAPLAAFFGLYAAALLPNAAALHPAGLAAALSAALPASLACVGGILVNWTSTLFFIMGELWGSVAISLLFWSLADDVCSVDEAKTLYPKLGIAANVGLVLAGSFTRLVNEGVARGNGVLSVQIQCAAVVVMAGVMCAAKAFVDSQVRPYLSGGSRKEAKKKTKAAKAEAGGGEGKKPDTWAILRSSSRIRDIALMVMGFGICNKVFGWTWKSEMRKLYPAANDYATVMGDVASYTGIVTICLMLVSKWTFQLLKWRGAALATPVVMAACGGTFFLGSVLAQYTSVGTATGAAALLIAAGPVSGIVCQVFGRASKYSLFDPCKEMLFITMADKREKESGKAAVDIVGNQIGKSGGAWVMQGLILLTGSMSRAMPATAVFFFAVVGVWASAALRLARTMAPEERQATVDENPPLEPPLPQKAKSPPPATAVAAAPAAAPAADGNGNGAGRPAAAAAAAAGAAVAAPVGARAAGPDLAGAAAAALAAGAPLSGLGSEASTAGAHDEEGDEEREVKSALQSHFD